MIDNLTTCFCERKSDAFYTKEIGPNLKMIQCFGCGKVANTAMTEGSEFLEQQMEILPDLYKELMGADENGVVFMPAFINIPDKGMVFADGTSATNWRWAAVKATLIKEEEKEKFKKKDGTYYEYKMDMETLKHFEEHDFIEALEYADVLNP